VSAFRLIGLWRFLKAAHYRLKQSVKLLNELCELAWVLFLGDPLTQDRHSFALVRSHGGYHPIETQNVQKSCRITPLTYPDPKVWDLRVSNKSVFIRLWVLWGNGLKAHPATIRQSGRGHFPTLGVSHPLCLYRGVQFSVRHRTVRYRTQVSKIELPILGLRIG